MVSTGAGNHKFNLKSEIFLRNSQTSFYFEENFSSEAPTLQNFTNNSSIDASWWADLCKTQEKFSKNFPPTQFWKNLENGVKFGNFWPWVTLNELKTNIIEKLTWRPSYSCIIWLTLIWIEIWPLWPLFGNFWPCATLHDLETNLGKKPTVRAFFSCIIWLLLIKIEIWPLWPLSGNFWPCVTLHDLETNLSGKPTVKTFFSCIIWLLLIKIEIWPLWPLFGNFWPRVT